MKAEYAKNYMVLDLLKNILSMAENPHELSKYITTQIRELIGCKTVALIAHLDVGSETKHKLLGICPERNTQILTQNAIEVIAEFSHKIHKTCLVNTDQKDTPLGQWLESTENTNSIILPLELVNRRVGVIVLLGILDIHNLQSVLDSLDALSGVLALELRNGNLFENMESIVANRTYELSQSQKRFRNIIEQTTDAMYLTDLRGQIIDVNIQACKAMEYTREELLGLNITDLDANHNTKEKTLEFFETMLPDQNLIFESVHRKKSGKIFPVEISTSKIELDGDNHVIGFARDITNRKIAAEALRESEEHFRILFEQASDGILISDENGKYTDVNNAACNMFGYTIEEFTGLTVEDLFPEDKTFRLNTVFEKIKKDGIMKTETKFMRKDLTLFDAEIVVKGLPDGKLQAMFHDISDRKLAEEEISKLNEVLEQKVLDRTKELEKRTTELSDNQKALLNLVEDLNDKSIELLNKSEQLQNANKELEAFSYSVSHDLRAPLRAINGFVSILIEDYYNNLDDEGKRICNIIQSNAMKMGQLIDDLLSFSRLIRSEIKQSEIDMEYLVKQTVSELSSQMKLTNIKLVMEEIKPAKGDPSMIRQVWINLISNAIKYSSLNEQINIQIGADVKDEEIIYYIKDNGIGFDMNYSSKLFGVFQRLHNRKEFDGTGVGLAIVQRIIHRHNGRVWAESILGNGSTFYFTIPYQPQTLEFQD